MKLENLQDLYVDELKDLYSAETQIVKALPKMAEAAASPELRQSFDHHLQQTKGHVSRLEQILRTLGEDPDGNTCEGMKGIIEEGQEVLKQWAEPPVKDAALIGAAQRVEHYEIAGYGTARTHAQQLGDQNAARLLQQTLEEEGQTDKKLSTLAESMVNVQAVTA